MNNKNTVISFSFIKLVFLKLLPAIFLLSSISIFAEETQKNPPKVSLGIGGSFSYYNVHHKYGDYPEWDGGFGFGGGFIFESMLTDMFGIHSGVWYSTMELTIRMPEDHSTTDDVIIENKIKSNLISIPFFLIHLDRDPYH